MGVEVLKAITTSKYIQQYFKLKVSSLRTPFDAFLMKQPSWVLEKYYPHIYREMRKWIKAKLDPANLCPPVIVFWLMIPPYTAIGISVLSFREIGVYLRQQMEPNETVYLMFKVFEVSLPYALTMLVTFSCFGLVITDAAYRVTEAIKSQYEGRLSQLQEGLTNLTNKFYSSPEGIAKKANGDKNYEKKHSERLKNFDPYNITPRMSIYFPVYDNHLSLGFLTIDFRHVELSLKQSLEPNDTIYALIRFIDMYSPAPLQILVLTSAVGLYFLGQIHRFEADARESILNKYKGTLSH